MRPHPTIRKSIKWGGAAGTLVLFATWIVSGRWTTDWLYPTGRDIGIGRGQIWCIQYAPSSSAQLVSQSGIGRFTRVVDGMSGRASYDLAFGGGGGWRSVILPIWPFVCAALLITIIAWRLETLARRRALLNLCPKCNYDRAGLEKGAVCPECGSALPN